MNRSILAYSFMLAAVACGSEDPGANASQEGSSETADGIFTITNNDDDTSSSSGIPPETSADSSSGDGPTQLNCEKIDFVFVIDNSSSMADEQQNLVDAVPGFVESMRTALPTVKSFRVGVVDTDAYPDLGVGKDPLDGCPAENADCTSCDYTLGAFLDKPLSAIDPTSSCNFSTAGPFMEGAAEAFPDEFACAAIVGTDGNPIEQQVGALLAAVDPAASAEGACNEGFLRDDALLVFLMITDEEDDHTDMPAPQGGSLGEPQEWYDAVVAAKNGKANNIVGLGLIGGSPRFEDCAALSMDGNGAEQSSRLEQFLLQFDTHFEGSVCSPNYGMFFDEALATVSQGCMNFIP
jgi:hypothetical protein